MNALAQHFSFEFRTGVRNRSLLLMNYLFPLVFYLLMGSLMGQVNPGFLMNLIPAMAVLAVMSGTLLALPGTLVAAREAGIFRSYRINGVPALSTLVIPVLTGMVHAFVVAILVSVSARPLFGAVLPVSWPGFLLVFLVMAFAFAGIAALIGVISSNTQMTVMLSQLIFLPSMILGGLMVPSSLLPEGLGKVALILPTTYATSAFGGLAMGQPAAIDPWLSLGILLTGGALAFLLAEYLFSWDSKNAARRGHPLLALVAWIPYLAGVLFSLLGG
jgi:ABC-2 type transport system permease protein